MSVLASARPYFSNHGDSKEDQFNVEAVLYWLQYHKYSHDEVLDCNQVGVSTKQADQWTEDIVSPLGLILLSSQTSWHLIKHPVDTLGTKTETPSCISRLARKYEKESLYTKECESYHVLRFLIRKEYLQYSMKSVWKEVFRIYVAEHCLQGCDTALYCIVVGSRRLMPPDALQQKAYCTNPGL